MIKFLRVDDRFLHGQVAFSWTRFLGVNCILIANDLVVNDELRKMSINLAKPPGIKLLIMSVNDAVNFIKSSDAEKFSIFVLTDNMADTLQLCEGISEIKLVNIGGMRMKPGKRMVSLAVAVDDADIEIFKKLADLGVEIEVRQVPAEKKKNIFDII